MTTSHRALDLSATDARLPRNRSRSGQILVAPGADVESKPSPKVTMNSAVYNKHRTVFDDNDAADSIYEVESGAVILTRPGQRSQRQVIEIVGPGGIFGMSSSSTHGCRAETMMRTVVRYVPRSAAELSASLQRIIGEALTRKLEKLHEQTDMRARMSATECVAAFILSLPKRQPDLAGEGAKLSDRRLALSQADMANHLGLAVETVCRAIKRLRAAGAIRTSGREVIEILDRRLLEQWEGEAGH